MRRQSCLRWRPTDSSTAANKAMKLQTIILLTAVVSNAFSVALNTAHAEALFFRIVNEAGTVELKSQLTPEEAKRGYSVVTLGGHVVETVKPELTAEQIAAQSAEEQAERAQQAQKAYDEALMLRFASMLDFETEQRRKLSDFDTRISILRNNLAAHKEKLDNQQQRAASIERKGHKVPESISKRIAELERKIHETNASIQQRIAEKAEVAKQYEEDGERLAQLLARIARKTDTPLN